MLENKKNQCLHPIFGGPESTSENQLLTMAFVLVKRDTFLIFEFVLNII